MTPTSPSHFHDLGSRSIHRSDITPIELSKLVVVTAISNPVRYRTRYNLYRKFAKHVQESGVQLMTVEMAFGDGVRPFEVTTPDNPWNVQLRSTHELWHKENMLNIGISRIPIRDWQYVAWIDSDIDFVRPDWAQETIHQLQHYQFVQMFSTALDIGPPPALDVIGTNIGMNYCYLNPDLPGMPPLIVDGRLNHKRHVSSDTKALKGGEYGLRGKDGRIFFHPGYAHAARRSAIDIVGGLLDIGILGAGDHHMALALLGLAEDAMPADVTPEYRDVVMQWQARCDRYIRRNIGYVPGVITHGYHGPKADRKYWSRWRILSENKFNPHTDIKRDAQGLWQLHDDGSDRSVLLRDLIRGYFRGRNEDSSI